MRCVAASGRFTPKRRHDYRATARPTASAWTWDTVGKSDGAFDSGIHHLCLFATLPLFTGGLSGCREPFACRGGDERGLHDSELESLLAFDRHHHWGEHATIVGQFLEHGRTVDVDVPPAAPRPRSVRV